MPKHDAPPPEIETEPTLPPLVAEALAAGEIRCDRHPTRIAVHYIPHSARAHCAECAAKLAYDDKRSAERSAKWRARKASVM